MFLPHPQLCGHQIAPPDTDRERARAPRDLPGRANDPTGHTGTGEHTLESQRLGL